MIYLTKIKLVVVEDHTVLRQTLVKSLNMEFDMEVIAGWSSGEEAVDYLKTDSFDVAVIDMKLTGMNGIETIRALKKIDPNVKAIILSAFSGEHEVLGAIEAGAVGYLPKTVTVEALVEAVRSVYRGFAVIDPSVAGKVFEIVSQKSQYSRQSSFSVNSDEKRLLELASQGLTNEEIAEKLNISGSKVKKSFSDILKKLDACDRTQAVANALRTGIID